MSFRVRRRVAFSETDASGRVHFSRFLTWVEDAEHQLLGSLDIPVLSESEGWPRVQVQCDYRQSVSHDEEVEIELGLGEVGKSSLKWAFRVLKSGGEVAAQGAMVTVYVSGEKACALSESVVTALKQFSDDED